jgi:hypothetical protein
MYLSAIDLAGNVVLTARSGIGGINVSSLKSGVYFLDEADKKSNPIKFIKS